MVYNGSSTPVDAERKFELEILGKKVIGYIDRIDRTTTGEYEVIDYKTGNSQLKAYEAREDTQMNMYALAVEKLYDRLPITTSLLYLRKENKVTYEVTKDSVQEPLRRIELTISNILEERFEATPSSFTCKHCDYKSICEAREVEED